MLTIARLSEIEDDFKILALKIECAQIDARRNMPEAIGVGLRPSDRTFLPIADRLVTLKTAQIFYYKFCISLLQTIARLNNTQSLI